MLALEAIALLKEIIRQSQRGSQKRLHVSSCHPEGILGPAGCLLHEETLRALVPSRLGFCSNARIGRGYGLVGRVVPLPVP
jgi:hypothetical protein